MRHVRWTLVIGLSLIVICEFLLAINVQQRGGVVIGPGFGDPGELAEPVGFLGRLARWAAFNMTALCWVGYLLVFDGLLGRAASPLRRRPNRFIVAWLTSIPLWCFFDWVNFTGLDAWRYYGLPPHFWQRLIGYFIAFAAISPGMFLAAELYQRLGLRRIKTSNSQFNQRLCALLTLVPVGVLGTVVVLVRRAHPDPGMSTSVWIGPIDLGNWLLLPGAVVFVLTRRLHPAALVWGLTFTLWAVLVHNPVGDLTLWVGIIFLVDPINAWLGAPSLLEDWQAGRWGRWLALMAGGATCGLCWEFWNYWALAKWSYNLPFLGSLEHYRYFEMPWLGFLGFLPFALECWVALNLIIVLLDRVGLRVAEPLPQVDSVL